MHVEGIFRHVPFRVDVPLPSFPGRHVIDQLYTTDLYYPVACGGIQTCCFSVEYDFAHARASGWGDS